MQLSTQPAVSALADRYLAAQLAADRRQALRVIVDEAVGQGLAVPDLYRVIEQAQHQIGELWQQNRISVAQEHLATAISQLALAHLYPLLPREPDNGKQVVLACAEGELHDLGPRMAADFFEMAGFQVRFLGASVPTDSLVGMIRESGPDLLVLSATTTLHLGSLRNTVYACRNAGGDRLHLGLGGLALEWVPRLGAQLGVDVAGGSAPEMIAAARQALGAESAA